MASDYGRILAPTTHLLAEGSSYSYALLSERYLQALWLEQKYFKPLQTSKGEAIEVISPGIWNNDAGPDFRKAHVRIGGKECVGDIEIHMRPDDWTAHRHHEDAHYDNVILHIALWAARQDRPFFKSNGELLQTTYLEPQLTIPVQDITQLIDLDLYPFKQFLGQGRCSQQLFSNLSQAQVEQLFAQAAMWRLEKKCEFLHKHVGDSKCLAEAGMAVGLGYPNNSQAFLELFLWLTQRTLTVEEQRLSISELTDKYLAWIMGATQFFNPFYREKWGQSSKYQELYALWQEHPPHTSPPSFNLILHHVRPLNHPIRRFAFLSKMAADPACRHLLARFEACWNTNWRHRKLLDQLIDLCPHYEDPYWNTHYTFEQQLSGDHLPLVGAPIKQEWLVNTILPLLWESIKERSIIEEIQCFHRLFGSLRAPRTGKAQYLSHRFFEDGPHADILQKARAQQGAYQIHRDFCVHFEASCEGCSFPARVQQNFPFVEKKPVLN